MAEMQIQLFLLLASGKIDTPTSPENYHLLHSPTSRIQYGVDYSTYMAQLAKDMGSAPSLKALMSEYGWFVTFLYWYVSLTCFHQDEANEQFRSGFPYFLQISRTIQIAAS